ncbi:hypothetical protein LSTR_LSTR004824 [Laodelphax striatellus]|uniref:Uncharacterized protein n=1 Tax=Laodelphax striatellus TaxID=195883 RepID=A0A482WI59_LAOST|nr:hypothetical protein LSTR_LSTR004824 [Laodelphax striatellus]
MTQKVMSRYFSTVGRPEQSEKENTFHSGDHHHEAPATGSLPNLLNQVPIVLCVAVVKSVTPPLSTAVTHLAATEITPNNEKKDKHSVDQPISHPPTLGVGRRE